MADPRLLEAYLRMSPEEAKRRQSEQLRDWFEKQQEVRQEKLGESLGVGDAALFAKPAQVAGGWLADLLGRTRVEHKTRDTEKEQGEAAFPVFGATPTGQFRKTAQRAARLERDLPFFNPEGLMAPGRQRQLESRMRQWIPLSSSKDPDKLHGQLDEWIGKQGGDWGRKPLAKEKIIAEMPYSLSEPFQQSLKEMGYGGIWAGRVAGAKTVSPGGAVPWQPDLRTKVRRPEQTARTWEEIKAFEQKGGVPSGWSSANPGKQPKWVRRPGEQLPEGIEDFLEEIMKARTAGR